MPVDAPKYSCPGCGSTYSWQKEIAGKRGTCKCGQPITVPLHPSQTNPLANDSFARPDSSSGARTAVISPTPSAAPAAAVASAVPIFHSAKNLDFGNRDNSLGPSRFHSDIMTDAVRDLLVPAAMLVAGFVGALIWTLLQPKAETGSLVTFSLLTAAATLIKTAILIILALVIAPWLGISFGLMGPAILKFAAIILFVDTAELWLNMAFKSAGGISASGQTSIYIIIPWVGLATTLISLSCYYLFRMDGSEVAMFAIPMAIISWLIGFIMSLFLASVLAAIVATANAMPVTQAAPATAAPVAVVSPAQLPAAVSPAPASVAPSVLDQAISHRIHENSPVTEVFEGNQWKMQNRYTPSDKLTDALIDQMYAAGAIRVYIDILGVRSLKIAAPVSQKVAYIELPDDQIKRDTCLAIAQKFRQDNGGPDFATALRTRRYLIVGLKP